MSSHWIMPIFGNSVELTNRSRWMKRNNIFVVLLVCTNHFTLWHFAKLCIFLNLCKEKIRKFQCISLSFCTINFIQLFCRHSFCVHLTQNLTKSNYWIIFINLDSKTKNIFDWKPKCLAHSVKLKKLKAFGPAKRKTSMLNENFTQR